MEERHPIVAPVVDLRRRADPVVAVPAEARSGRAMELGEHLRKRRPVAVALQVELFKKNEIRTVVENLRHADHGAERTQAIHFRFSGWTLLAKTLSQRRGACWRDSAARPGCRRRSGRTWRGRRRSPARGR